jgi:hypothetical protein
MSFNRSPFRTGRHQRSAAPRATPLLSSRTSVCWVTERPQFLQLEYLHKTFAREDLIESVLTNYHELFRKSLLPTTHPRPVCQLLSSNHRHVYSIPSSYSYNNTTSSPCSSKRSPSAPLSRFPSPAPVLLSSCSSNSPLSSRWRPKLSSHYPSNSLVARLTSATPWPWWMRVLAMEIMRG